MFESQIRLIYLEDPNLWKSMYGSYSYETVSWCLVGLASIQVVLLLLICKYKVRTLMCGIRWGDLQ